MKKLGLVGRILFALPFAIMGLNHFLMTDIFTGMMSTFIPGGGFTILLTGAMLIIASVSIMLNKSIKIACYWLAGMLFLFIVTIHIPHLVTLVFQSPDWNMSLVNLLKDTSLLGGALIIANHFGSQKETKK